MAASRFSLLIRAYIFRAINRVVSYLDRNVSASGRYPAASPRFIVTIPSTVSKSSGNFALLFYGPKSLSREGSRSNDGKQSRGRPVVINFHGGGFTIGAANNDARWASAVLGAVEADSEEEPVMISVEYRLAPKFPHPVGVEDGVDAILWVWAHAAEYGLDPSRTVLTGFSAGANFSLSVALRLYEEVTRRKSADTLDAAKMGTLSGIVSFYPSTNYSLSREERSQSIKAPDRPAKQAIPPFLYALFDGSYLHPIEKLDLAYPFLSPGLAPDEMILRGFPDRLAIFTCEWDQLHNEGEVFRERLKALGKHVGGSTIKAVDHSWDKRPTFGKENPKRDAMYAEAAKELQDMFK